MISATSGPMPAEQLEFGRRSCGVGCPTLPSTASTMAACTCRSGSIDPKTSSAIDCRELLGGRAQCLAWRRRRGTSTKGQLLATVTHCSQLSPAFHRISVFVKARRNGKELRCLLSLVTMAATAALWLMETDPAPRICLRHSFSSADEVCSTTASDGVLFLTGPSTFPGSSKISESCLLSDSLRNKLLGACLVARDTADEEGCLAPATARNCHPLLATATS